MKVVDALLKMWKRQGHRVLLFCQTKQMLDIIEMHVKRSGLYPFNKVSIHYSSSILQFVIKK